MKLLSKDELNKAKTLEKSQAVLEGLKLSTKVDSLRRTQADEEAQYEKWRIESIAEIQKQINGKIEQKESLESQIKLLEEQAKRELSKTDKKRLEDLKESLNQREKDIEEQSFQLDLKELDILASLKEADDLVAQQRTAQENAQNLQREASRKESEAAQILKTSQLISERAVQEKEAIENDIAVRLGGIAAKEREVIALSEENIRIQRELQVEKVQIADQRATLERAMERLRNNRLA